MRKPNIGDTVIYRNRYGETDLPAVVVVTVDTHVEVSPKPQHAENPPIAPPTNGLHVHLKVLAPGPADYAELDVPGWEPLSAPGMDKDEVGRYDAGDRSMVPARSWRWPDRSNVEHLDVGELVNWEARQRPLA